VSVKEKLKALQGLQKVALEILQLQREGEAYPKRLAEIDAQRASARTRVEAERVRVAENDRVRREKENEVQSEKEKIKKWEARLAEQRTTREYAALAREIDIAKKSVLNLEEEVKTLASDSQGLKRVFSEREGELARLEDATAPERSDLEQKMQTLSAQIGALEEKRTEAMKDVDPALAPRYEQVRKRRGTGLAPVVGGICKGCNMRMQPQLNNVLRAGTTIEVCPSCCRLIYAVEIFEDN